MPLLRPLRMGELLDQAVRLYRKNFFTFVGIISLVFVPVSLLPMLSALLMYSATTTFDDPNSLGLGAAYWAGLSLTGFSIVLQIVLIQGLGTTALTRAIADNYLGQQTGVLRAYSRVGRSWLRVLLALVLVVMISIAVMIWAMVPCVGWASGFGLYVFLVGMVLPLVAPAIVIERADAITGLRRAWDLARRRFWWLLGYVLLLGLFSLLVVTGPSYVASFLVALLGGDALDFIGTAQMQTIAQTLVSILTGVVFFPLQMTAITLAYFDLRVRTEGFDLALLAAEASDQAGVDAASQAAAMREARPLLTWEDVGRFAILSVGMGALVFLIISLFFAFLAGLASFM
jgi:hypothetical protein